jgi:hypothetical protein
MVFDKHLRDFQTEAKYSKVVWLIRALEFNNYLNAIARRLILDSNRSFVLLDNFFDNR